MVNKTKRPYTTWVYGSKFMIMKLWQFDDELRKSMDLTVKQEEQLRLLFFPTIIYDNTDSSDMLY